MQGIFDSVYLLPNVLINKFCYFILLLLIPSEAQLPNRQFTKCPKFSLNKGDTFLNEME